MRSLTFLLSCSAISFGSFAFYACSSSESSVDTGDASTDASLRSDSSTSQDSGEDDAEIPIDPDAGSEEFSDGGANIDLDAGVPDPGDGGILIDAGDGGVTRVCNALKNDGPVVKSTCAAILPRPSGGPLVAGVYELSAVTQGGSVDFCQNTFKSTSHQAVTELTVDGKGVVTANRVFQLSGTGISLGPFHVNQTYVPAVGNKTPLVATAVCPAALSQTTMEYSSFILRADMKQHLRLRTVGNSGAVTLYDFVKR